LVSRYCSRGAGASEFWRMASPKGEGTARQMARESLICTPSCDHVSLLRRAKQLMRN
jgi:hypothetical protein